MLKKKKILIAGGGLAGSFLAARLCLRGHSVTLSDEFQENSASRVAGGLFNIITGRLAAKTWMAETLLGEMKAFFELDPFSSLSQYLHFAEIYRPFKTAFESNEWFGKSSEEKFASIVRVEGNGRLPEQIDNDFGGLTILPCGWAEAANVIKGIREILVKEYGLNVMPERFDAAGALELLGEYDEIVFAEGVKMLENPFFDWLPLHPLKGQVLELEIPGFEPGFILSKKIFLIPKGQNRFICGATYEKHFENDLPDEKGIAELSEHLKKTIKLPYSIINQRAGLRPTTPNRRPMLGTHPDHKHLHVFNGLGTKGMLQAPYFSEMMAKYLEGDKNCLIKDVNINRYSKHFT